MGCVPSRSSLSPSCGDVPVWGHQETSSSPGLERWLLGSRYQLGDAGEPDGLLESTDTATVSKPPLSALPQFPLL